MSGVEAGKQAAAIKAVDVHIKVALNVLSS